MYVTNISRVDCHGEKTSKHFDQYGGQNVHDDKKNTFHFSAIGQFTDTITLALKHEINVLGELLHFADMQ